MNNIRVKDLLELCKKEIAKGNGNKKILISDDDEGNGYHQLLYSFCDDTIDFKDFIYCVKENELNDYIILG